MVTGDQIRTSAYDNAAKIAKNATRQGDTLASRARAGLLTAEQLTSGPTGGHGWRRENQRADRDVNRGRGGGRDGKTDIEQIRLDGLPGLRTRAARHRAGGSAVDSRTYRDRSPGRSSDVAAGQDAPDQARRFEACPMHGMATIDVRTDGQEVDWKLTRLGRGGVRGRSR